MEPHEDRAVKELVLGIGEKILWGIFIFCTFLILAFFWGDILRGDTPREQARWYVFALGLGIAYGHLWLLNLRFKRGDKWNKEDKDLEHLNIP